MRALAALHEVGAWNDCPTRPACVWIVNKLTPKAL
jgi:hypothetical protein